MFSSIQILEIDRIPKKLVIGRQYHCTWANHPKMKWTLVNLLGNYQAVLIVKNKKQLSREPIQTHINNLRVIDVEAIENAINRINSSKNKSETELSVYDEELEKWIEDNV